MSEIELYVHSGKGGEETLVKIGTEASVADLLKKIHEAGICDGPAEELHIFAEEADEPFNRDHTLEQCGCKHRHHVHCHKCHKVQVVVLYNGVEKNHSFAPGTKVKRVLKWAINEFQLKGADAENKVLRLAEPPETELPNEAHIGSYAHAPKCGLKVCLVSPTRFNG